MKKSNQKPLIEKETVSNDELSDVIPVKEEISEIPALDLDDLSEEGSLQKEILYSPAIGDIVSFHPTAEEVYSYLIPQAGTLGKVRLLTYNVGLQQMLGITLNMCIVDFDIVGFRNVSIYDEDLVLVSREKVPSDNAPNLDNLKDHIN